MNQTKILAVILVRHLCHQRICDTLKLTHSEMTEASVDGINPVESQLRSDSRILVIIGSPEGLKAVSKRLSSLEGVTRIRRGLFIVQHYSESHDGLIQTQPSVSFAKTREILTVRERQRNAYSVWTYSLVSFSYNNPTSQQKKYVERLIRKTSGIRLRPGVILFPLLRSKERRRIIGSEDEKKLIDSTEFVKLIQVNGGSALRWSRLRITSHDGDTFIKQAVQLTCFRDLRALEERIKTLRERLKDSDVPLGQLKKNYSLLSRSFKELKTKWMLARKLWHYDFEKPLKRTYNMLVNTRRAIASMEM